MTYQINKTDGTIVATVADGQIDIKSTDLTLIGKNYSGFGESLNENFIKILENFAGTSRPSRPLRGQLWYDASELKLKAYSGTEFLPVSSASISNIQPTTLGIGDLWFNSIDKQLFFFDGSDIILLAPAYSSSQSQSGLQVASIIDTLNQTRVITYLYTNGALLGIWAKDSFTPKESIVGFTGNIIPGFNVGNLSGLKFNVTCTNAEQLGLVSAATYVRKDTANAIAGQLQVTTDLGVLIGGTGQANIFVTNGTVFLSNAATDKSLILNVRKGITQENAIVISADSRTIGLYTGFASSQVNIGGNLTITGDLTVEGVTTTLNTSTITIEDKNIELGKVAIPSNSTADGGGITLKGSTDKSIIWTSASSSWNSTEHINLATSKSFKIDGVEVLSSTSLGLGITAIPGVTSFGTQNIIRIGPGIPPIAEMVFENHRISTIYNDFDLELEPNGAGNIALIGSPKIIGLADPVDLQDAATKEYVDVTIESRPLVFSIELSDGKPNSYIITNILNNIAPVLEYRPGTIARILCSISSNSATSLAINPLVHQSSAIFNTPTGTAAAVTNVAIETGSIAAASISVTRIIKEFQLLAGVWSWSSDTLLPA